MYNLPSLKRSRNSGQALLIILLVMSVVLTTVLSVVSRSVTEISVSTYEESSARALSAAEAGVEEALISGGSTSGTLPQGAPQPVSTFDAVVSDAVATNDEFMYPSDLSSGETATFWFVSHDPANNDLICSSADCLRADFIELCWGSSAVINDSTPAIEVAIFHDPTPAGPIWEGTGDFSDVEVFRVAYDPFVTVSPRTPPNNFGAAQVTGCNIGDESYPFRTGQISLASVPNRDIEGGLIMARVKMFYNPSEEPVGIIATPLGGTQLPAQGINIESTGVSGETTRKLNVFQSFPSPPLIFDSAVFSFGDLVK